MRPDRERFLPYAREGCGRRRGAGGLAPHRREPLGGARRRAGAARGTRLGPPGVDMHRSARGPADLERLAARVEAGRGRRLGRRGGRRGGPAHARPARDRIVSYVGKLIVSKGVDLLLAAWPLVVARVPEARLMVVGFGTYREALERFVDALARATSTTRARSPRAGASSRAARRAS